MLPCSKCSADVANQDKETFDSFLGQADEVVQERVCDDELILVKRYVAGQPLRNEMECGSCVRFVVFSVGR